MQCSNEHLNNESIAWQRASYQCYIHNINSTLVLFSGKSMVATGRVAFFVGLEDNMGPVPDNVDIVFDKIVTNVGNAYDETTGRFVAPYNGTYHFTAVVAAQGRQKVRLEEVIISHCVCFK